MSDIRTTIVAAIRTMEAAVMAALDNGGPVQALAKPVVQARKAKTATTGQAVIKMTVPQPATVVLLPAPAAKAARKPSTWHFATLVKLGLKEISVGTVFAYTPRKSGVVGKWAIVSIDEANGTVQALKQA
jgi:hypothetical protein